MLAKQSAAERVSPGRRMLLVAVVAALLAFLHGPTLLRHAGVSLSPWHFADDVRVLIHPLFRLEDPALFAGDPSADYYLRSLPDGYHLLYRLFGPLLGVATLSKLLPYVLLAVTLAALGFVAGRLSGAGAAFGTLALALGSPYLLGCMAGGLPRSFALPLLAVGAALLFTGRMRALAALVVIAAGFYPVAALVLGASLTLVLLLPGQDRGSAGSWSLRTRLGVLAATGLAAALVLAPSAFRLGAYGATITPADWHEFPEAGPGGRFDPPDRAPFPPFPEAATAPLVAALSGIGDAIVPPFKLAGSAGAGAVVVALLALAGWIPLALRRADARRLLVLLAAVVSCHALSLAAGLRLFIPERYVAYGIPILALVAVPAALGAFHRALPWFASAGLVALFGAHGSPWTGLTVGIPPEERPLYEFVASLPKSAVVAGFPGEVIDNVPYLSRRTAFITRETQMAFHTGFTRLQRSRTRAFIDGYFAAETAALRELRDRSGVTHLLVDRRHFERRPSYFAPFDPEIARAFAAQKRAGSAVLAAIPSAKRYELGAYVVLDLARL